MASQHGSGLISRAVREALSTLVSPQMCEQVIARSLAADGLADIPESGAELGGWLEGALREEVETAVGADAADLLVAQLGPIAAYASVAKPRTPAPIGQGAANANAPVAKPRRSVENLAAAIEAMTSQLPPTLNDFDDFDFDTGNRDNRRFDDAGAAARSPTLRSSPPVGGVQTPRVETPTPAIITPFVSPAVGRTASSERNDSTRPTELRFNLGATPDYSATPHHGSSFGSEPPTASFARPGGAMTLPAPDSRSVPDISVRTLPPPVKHVPAVNDTRSLRPRRTAMPERNSREARGETEGHPLPIVLTATSNLDDLAAIRRYLAGTATVVHVPDFVGLLDAIDEPGAVEPIVLIDCQRPTVHITSVSAIGEDLPRGTTVVLWGADEHTWQQVDRDRTPSCRWVRCSSEATPHDVGSLCSMLLG